MEIFIETNRSPVPYVQRETLEVYDENVHGKNCDQQSEPSANPYMKDALAATTASDGGPSAPESEAGPNQHPSPQ